MQIQKNWSGARRAYSSSNVPPQTPSAIQALGLLSQPLPYSRRAMVGTDRLAGPPTTPFISIRVRRTFVRRRSSQTLRVWMHHLEVKLFIFVQIKCCVTHFSDSANKRRKNLHKHSAYSARRRRERQGPSQLTLGNFESLNLGDLVTEIARTDFHMQ